jgi:hypothetical protein
VSYFNLHFTKLRVTIFDIGLTIFGGGNLKLTVSPSIFSSPKFSVKPEGFNDIIKADNTYYEQSPTPDLNPISIQKFNKKQ